MSKIPAQGLELTASEELGKLSLGDLEVVLGYRTDEAAEDILLLAPG